MTEDERPTSISMDFNAVNICQPNQLYNGMIEDRNRSSKYNNNDIRIAEISTFMQLDRNNQLCTERNSLSETNNITNKPKTNTTSEKNACTGSKDKHGQQIREREQNDLDVSLDT